MESRFIQIHKDKDYKFEKIICLVPSLTETIFDFNAGDRLIAATKFCIHPQKELSCIEKVGGTKTLDLEKIVRLKPDLVIANKEENTQKEIEYISQFFPVWLTDIKDLNDLSLFFEDLGIILNQREIASDYQQFIKEVESKKFESLDKNVAYLIWRKPYMSVGKDTYIHQMIGLMGLQSVTGNQVRYPEIHLDELISHSPDFLFLSSEPYPFKEKHILELDKFLPQTEIRLVDGEMFSWYGSRIKKAIPYFEKLYSQCK